ncbi:site-2 protease family protein [Paraconexibacter sp.]|uniref:site-2 protease family protein n=1 Tax=Paraconexibacter sp. TaxID=2949640 RepID=UPI00356B14D6
MIGRSSVQLGRIFGIRIGASPSWFLFLFLMIYFLSGWFRDVLGGSETEAYLVAVAGALLFFTSLIAHELGHALVARRAGIGIEGIDLWFFGGLAKLSRDSRSPGEEFRIAAAGPAVTLLVCALCLGLGLGLSRAGEFFDNVEFTAASTSPTLALASWLFTINAFLFVFNMVPAFPLDGGRIARAIAWRVTGDKNRGTRFSARLGQGFSYILIGVGALLAFTSDPINGVWLMVLGWFLGQAATGAVATSEFSERIDGVTVGDLMDSEPVAMPADTAALRAQEDFFLRYGWPWFPVVDPASGRFLGILPQERVDGAVAQGQPVLPVADMLDATPDEYRISSDEPLESLLTSEPLRRLGALMVVDGEERLCGVVTVEQVRRALGAAAGAAD